MFHEPTQGNRLSLTNNYSILSKYSASKQGFFKDQILEDFLEYAFQGDSKLFTRRTAQVNLGYAARQMAVDWNVTDNFNPQTDCHIILGAGFDMLSLRDRSKDCHWIEIDLPDVIDVKRRYISDKFCTGEGDVLVSNDGKVVSFIHLRLHLISGDLRNTTELMESLSHAFKNVPPVKRNRVKILNEVCLCYLERSEAEQILKSIRNFLISEQSHFMYYVGLEQVKPPESSRFAELMSEHFLEMGFPLKNFPTRDELLDLFTNKLKFRYLNIIPMYQVFHNLLIASSDINLRDREPFDEYEELDLYLSHYALVTGQCNLRFDSNTKQPSARVSDLIEGISDMNMIQEFEPKLEYNHEMGRYGHASCVLDDNTDGGIALYTGGYGFPVGTNIDHPFQRLGDCALIKWHKELQAYETGKLRVVEGLECDLHNLMSRLHGQVCHLGGDLVLFNGGRQSPAKAPNAPDNSFIGRVNTTQLTFELVGTMNTTNSLRWRHRTIKFDRDQLIQLGGIRGKLSADDEGAIGLWNLSSDKLGFSSVFTDELSQKLALDRHSFGADLRDAYSLLIFGGLRHSMPFDRPINSAQAVLMVDLRCLKQPIPLRVSGECYDLHVHFLDDFKFIKYGGISTLTGLSEDSVELYDLRQSQRPIAKSQAPDNSPCRFIPTRMTSVHFKQPREIISLGGGGTYFTFGSHFNNCTHRICYDGS